MIVALDCETTGLFDDREIDDAAPHQPRLVRICCALYEEDREVALIDLTAKPDGWIIPDKVAEIHGTTQQMAVKIGIPVRSILSPVVNLSKAAEAVITYGDYDLRIVMAELKRMNVGTPFPGPGVERVDVMRLATEWCKISHPNGDGFKFPKLVEATKILLGEDIPPHACLLDMRAAYRIWRFIKQKENANVVS